MLAELVAVLRQFGELVLDDDTAALLVSMSAATVACAAVSSAHGSASGSFSRSSLANGSITVTNRSSAVASALSGPPAAFLCRPAEEVLRAFFELLLAGGRAEVISFAGIVGLEVETLAVGADDGTGEAIPVFQGNLIC